MGRQQPFLDIPRNREIARRYASGEPASAIRKDYGVSAQRIYQIVRSEIRKEKLRAYRQQKPAEMGVLGGSQRQGEREEGGG